VSRTLSSWKEIAAHFGRDVRTVQRWEKYEGLPVHRHAHRARHSIYAYTEELDAWWHGHGAPAAAMPALDGAPVAAAAIVEPAPPPAARPRLSRGLVFVAGALALAVAVLVPLAGVRSGSAGPDAPATRWDLDAPYDIVAAGDVDGDARTDVVLSAAATGVHPRVFRVNPDGSLGAPMFDVRIDRPVHLYVQAVSDVNGDGLDDLIVTTIHRDVAFDTSPAFIVFGRRRWPDPIELPRDADVRLELPTGYDGRLGWCGSPAPIDLNGDGLQDVMLAAPEFSTPERGGAGAVFVLFGRRKWPGSVALDTGADTVLLGSRAGEGLGMGCAAGDWDGDGRPELAAHAAEHTLWAMRRQQGRTYVVSGREHWPRLIDLASDFLLRVDNPVPRSVQTRMVFADVNGDGKHDLVRAGPHDGGETAEDAIRIWFAGRHAGVRSGADEDVRIDVPREAPGAGRLLVAADLDRDGAADLVLTHAATGTTWLIIGRTAWPRHVPLARAAVPLFEAGAAAWTRHLAAADVDSDGLPELVLPRGAEGARNTSIDVVPIYQRVTFDVRPGSERKLVLVPGAVAVRIPGAVMPADRIDASSLRLNGAAVKHARSHDDDGDGAPDLQLHFDSTDMALDGEPVVRLVGRRRDGRLLAGTARVEVIRRTTTTR
jgi:hypothetical protein